jgi:hypothetical protein
VQVKSQSRTYNERDEQPGYSRKIGVWRDHHLKECRFHEGRECEEEEGEEEGGRNAQYRT